MISAVIEQAVIKRYGEHREADAGRMITEVLLSLRLHRQWTQESLSARSGISVRTIRNLESGRIRNPRRSTVDLLLAVLAPDQRQSAGNHPGPGLAGRYPAQAARPREIAVMTRPSRTSHRPAK